MKLERAERLADLLHQVERELDAARVHDRNDWGLISAERCLTELRGCLNLDRVIFTGWMDREIAWRRLTYNAERRG